MRTHVRQPTHVRSLAIVLQLLFLPITVASVASAATIDLSGASTGTLITAPGGSFSQRFVGQTISGVDIVGSPTGALTLAPAGTITVARFGDVSLLSQPDNAGPLSILLDGDAMEFEWTMGASVAPNAIDVDLFLADGSLVAATSIVMQDGYNSYSISGFGTFRGITFHNNQDPGGVRFMTMSYQNVPGGETAVPEPSTAVLLCTGLIVLSARRQSYPT